jgi:hypothetical protein
MQRPLLTEHVTFPRPIPKPSAQKSKQSDMSQSLSLFSRISTARNTQNTPQQVG